MRTRTIVAACLAALLVVAVGVAVAPRVPTLSTAETGDPDLLDRARDLYSDGHRDLLGVVEVDGGTTSAAHFGGDGDTDYEIGSISKVMTALLLADAIERGEVTEETSLGELLDLGDAPAEDVVLVELVSHRSGLPRLASRPQDVILTVTAANLGRDPYRVDVPTLLDQARAARLTDRGESHYSNLGFALLGQALAEAAGTDYATLLRERVLDPIGMDDTYLPADGTELPADATLGHTDRGRTAAPWLAMAYAPAGGVRSTPADMERFARALLDGTAPGMAALEPRWDDGEDRIGYAWVVTDVEGTEVTWHNGGTGGFVSMLALDREADRAVVVLSNTTTDVEGEAVRLLTGRDWA
ncbi:serine hydrolase domain-containing protein [Nocardiopsis lambiniae]|uniref:Beta-lactamase n=1 Tax=Nocardiopsis lambiniae TaxID=3075539 RepID=A0ABU2M7I5_9ACTN|nr:serine hydrolase domain-containing protein [Nocardiopsis sp. DSM 44743]MDT0328638.1 serine hydrolase domain-containing protein [Nocardiopsis sp. DSM 44743]